VQADGTGVYVSSRSSTHSGFQSISVYDSDFDGQADIRTIRQGQEPTQFWLWIEGAWYRKLRAANAEGLRVAVEGGSREYAMQSGRPVFVDESRTES